jgi:endonuclease YncB( thermonuclease family)
MYTYKGVVTEVHDGDTLTADIDLGFGVWLKNQKCRLAKINAPELKGPTAVAAIAARTRLAQLVLNKRVTINTNHDQKEKFGRWLATILIEEDKNLIEVNSTLIAEGHAKTYN